MENRNSNIELMRIFAMLLIILHHFTYHGIFKSAGINNTLLLKCNNFIACFGSTGGKIGVILFILITGYFMINSSFKLASFLKTYFITLFYSVLLLIIVFLYNHNITSNMLNTSIFPFCGKAYWFVTVYLMLYLFIPFINPFIKKIINEGLHKKFLIITTVLMFLIPTFFKVQYNFCHFMYFVYFYCLGAFIRLKTFNFLLNRELLMKAARVSITLITIYIIFRLHWNKIDYIKAFKYSDMHSIFILLISLYIFNIFLNLKIPYNKYINKIAACVFPVYLIHDNDLVRPLLWEKILNPDNLLHSKFFIIYAIFIPLVIYILCLIADYLLKIIYKKPIEKLALRMTDFLTDKRTGA